MEEVSSLSEPATEDRLVDTADSGTEHLVGLFNFAARPPMLNPVFISIGAGTSLRSRCKIGLPLDIFAKNVFHKKCLNDEDLRSL